MVTSQILRGLSLIVLSYQCVQLAECAQYDEFKVLRVTISSSTDVIVGDVKHLQNKGILDILVLCPVRGIMDLMVGPKHLGTVLETLDRFNAEFKIQNDDIGKIMKHQAEEKISKLGRSSDSVSIDKSFHDDYHSYQDMVDRLEALEQSHPDKAEVFSLEGKTFENREIKAIRITNDISNKALSDSKPMVWLDGGIHSREWVSSATMMYFVDVMLGEEEQGRQDRIDTILDRYQIVIAPVINPDGYVFSCDGDSGKVLQWKTEICDRFWRKTRTDVGGCKENKRMWYGGCLHYFCWGADPNRNWDAEFDSKLGVSDNPCTIVFPGQECWDQPCVNIVKTYLEKNKEKLVLYVSYHAYLQLFLVPWAHSMEPPPHHEHHMKVGRGVVDAIRGVHGQDYEVIQVAVGLYNVSGSSIDWVYDKLGVVDAYGFELRPDGQSEYGFLLPKDQIRETGEENVAGLFVLIDNIYERANEDDGRNDDSDENRIDDGDDDGDDNGDDGGDEGENDDGVD